VRAELVAMKVIPRYPQSYFEAVWLAGSRGERVEKQWAEDGQAVVDAVQQAALAQGVKTKAVTVKSTWYRTPSLPRQKTQMRLIVMASHGRLASSACCWQRNPTGVDTLPCAGTGATLILLAQQCF